jgi:hypothetical protein
MNAAPLGRNWLGRVVCIAAAALAVLVSSRQAPAQGPGGVPAQDARMQPLVQVETPEGSMTLNLHEYEIFTRPMGHLPTMSREYIFGRKIPVPKTDQFGHIHLSNFGRATGAAAAEPPPTPASPVATTAKAKPPHAAEAVPKKAKVEKPAPSAPRRKEAPSGQAQPTPASGLQ